MYSLTFQVKLKTERKKWSIDDTANIVKNWIPVPSTNKANKYFFAKHSPNAHNSN